MTFNERERSELQTRYHSLEQRFHESQETSNRLLREVTRLRADKPSINCSPQQQQQQPVTHSISNHHSRLLHPQLTHFSAYELLRTRTIDSSTMPISSLQIILERIRPQSITQHIWQTLVDLIFFHPQNSTFIQSKQSDLTIGIDLTTMTAFYQMIFNTLHSLNNKQNRLSTNQIDSLPQEQLLLILDACAHFLFNTVKSTESLNKQENCTTMKKAQVNIRCSFRMIFSELFRIKLNLWMMDHHLSDRLQSKIVKSRYHFQLIIIQRITLLKVNV